jgi:hypothetical protein
MTVVLRNWRGSRLQVGASEHGWFLMLIHEPGIQFVYSFNEDDGENVPFLMPEWTELERYYLHPEEEARRALEGWVLTNRLDLFLPGKYRRPWEPRG